jgi:hypothetical protein
MMTIKDFLEFIKQYNLPENTLLAIQPEEFCSNYEECGNMGIITENDKEYIIFSGGKPL